MSELSKSKLTMCIAVFGYGVLGSALHMVFMHPGPLCMWFW